MSAHTRTLDRASRLVDELVVDALFMSRPRPLLWLLVALGFLAGLGAGLVATGNPYVAIVVGLVAAGFGVNAGSTFHFLARTPSRLLLLDSSRVIAKPTRIARTLAAHEVQVAPRGQLLRVTVAGRGYITGRAVEERVRRMLPETGDTPAA